MAKDTSESKNAPPSAKRLRDARRRGQVPKSAELSGALSLLCTLLCVVGMAPGSAWRIANFQLAVDRTFEALDLAAVQAMVIQALWLMMQLSLIPLGVAAGVFLLSLWLQTGTVFSLELVTPKLERLNPVDGLLRIFSVRSLVQFGLVLIKAFVVAGAACLVLFHILGDAIRVIYADAGGALAVASTALSQLMLWSGGLFVTLGALDLVYQRWQYLKDLRMSLSEVRREQRDDHGDGQLRSQRRSFSQDALPREQLAFIHMASLVVCDSHGRAIVLIHRPRQFPLPFVVVRGSGAFADEIRSLAVRHDVPVVDDAALAEALYPAAHAGMPIPGQHLDAVLACLRRTAE